MIKVHRYLPFRRLSAYYSVLAILACTYLTASPVMAQDALQQSSIKSPLAQHSLFMDIERVGNNLITVGERGHIMRSEDQGATWRQVEVPVRVALTASFFINERLGWAVGHDGVVLRSQDGGKNWTKLLDGVQANLLVLNHAQALLSKTETALANAKQEQDANAIEQLEFALENLELSVSDAQSFIDEGPTRPLLDLWFKNEHEGFIVGAFGLILHTLDGGQQWTPWFEHIENLDLFSFNAITEINGQLFIAAEAGNLYRSDDDGQQWTMLASPYAGSFFGINGVGQTGVIAFGLRGNAYVSADNGTSWTKVNTGVEASLFASTRLTDGSAVVVGAGGVMLFIDANGELLNTMQHPRKFPISAIIAGENDNLLTVGFGGIHKVEPLNKPLTATAEQSHD